MSAEFKPSNRPIKVLRVITRLNVGGPAQHVAYLTAGLASHGFESALVSGRIDPAEGDMAYFCEKLGAQVRYVDALIRPVSPLQDLAAFFQILRILRREKPDVLHTHLAKAGFLSRMAALLLKPFGVNPVVIHTFHGHVLHSYFSNRQNSLHLFLERFSARWTDRIVTVSERLRQELIHVYGIAPAEKFRVVPLGFDLAPFLQMPRHRGEFRKKIGVDEVTPLIGIVGRLTAVKDHALFLDSFLETLKEVPAAVAVIIGDGEEQERIRAHAERLGIPGRIRWTGFLKNLPEVYSDLTALALTSKNEGTPVAVIEAQASGCPVVAADVGGTSDAMPPRPGELVQDGRIERAGGFLIRRRTPVEFANAYLEILKGRFSPHPDARSLMAETFGVARLCEDIAHLYKNTLAACRPAD
ncbi:MAG: hypothetical protein A3G34_14795 [Candidatus Lindowbacteria bacterium RIFCSPLOWO2_12_FULL_62_27]|nr:MAG: hypothetical protein A3I06_10075 [Candidatus Lindowbacteria bacterium RIFCSPLOWO2_02_FULL_62_12]OGH63124.1 MAG: hypothetical protein A3G34_14795 [Candidatus Lindowbacteria bacterium RIFCSPLOWO2_12_FULL_62_27]